MTDNTPAVKFIEDEDGNWFVEGCILPYDGPVAGQDLTGTHFSKSTDFCMDWFPDGGRPGMYAHGFDAELGTSVVGREVKSWKSDKGVWLRAQIDKAHEYAAEIKQLVDEGLVSLSSGAVDHLVRVSAKSGEITRWPWVEWSIVPNPANPEAVLYPVKSTDAIAHLKEVGSELPVIRVRLDDLDVLTVKDSSAADDASEASMARAGLVQLLANEVGEGDQEAALRRAIDYLDRFIASETDEIGSENDQNESENDGDDAEMGAFLSTDRLIGAFRALTPQALHDAAKASGAVCAGEKALPEPVITVTEPAVDPAALMPDLVAVAQKAVKERLGL